MATAAEYEARIKKFNWSGLQKLWKAIQARDTPEWDPGKAFEYLILRAFELDGAEVHWPYSVYLFGEEIEQIDGSLHVGSLYYILECKDMVEEINVTAIAKLRNQLMRRPAATIGLLFSSGGFTAPTSQLAYFLSPQTILLWIGDEVDYCLKKKKIAEYCEVKYRKCIDRGVPDADITKGDNP